MSEERVTVGVVAELSFPVGKYDKETHRSLEEKLDLMDSKLKISYDGTMIIYVHKDTPAYEAGLVIFGENDDIYTGFIEELKKAGLSTIKKNKKVFVDNWYDGSDAPHMMLTLKKAGFRDE